jgi:phosphoglucosamine mutase
MTKLFGTDGIRGTANQEPITPETALKLGRAMVQYCRTRKLPDKIVIGRDTRLSGPMLEHALLAGILSMGADAFVVGDLPTPGIAYMTREEKAGAGLVLSASHNPYTDNGFKVFSNEGYKLSENEEGEIENLLSAEEKIPGKHSPAMGRTIKNIKAAECYIGFLTNIMKQGQPFQGINLVLDCSNGATSHVAPSLFEKLGAQVESLFISPNGKNINQDCGSQHPEKLRERVIETRAHLGLAFDGDGDRLIAVDHQGNVLTGDQIMIVCAAMLKDRGELDNDLVVTTVMSNMGFIVALKDLGIRHIATRVGDRHVMAEMRKNGAVLGGEESGHIIFHQYHTTGDGLLSAIQLLRAIKESGRPLAELSKLMTLFPQVMINVKVKQKPEIDSIPEIGEIVKQVENKLEDKGRVLVRYSGTEPLCRVMIEGEDRETIQHHAEEIARTIEKRLG